MGLKRRPAPTKEGCGGVKRLCKTEENRRVGGLKVLRFFKNINEEEAMARGQNDKQRKTEREMEGRETKQKHNRKNEEKRIKEQE